MLGLVRRQEEPIEGKSVWTGWKPQVSFYFCESCASIWKQLKHKGRAKSILSHAEWFIYFIVFDLRFATAREHVLVTKVFLGIAGFTMISVCAVRRCFCLLLIQWCTNFYIPTPPPTRKKPSELHFLKTGTWSVTPNSKWLYNNLCWGEENILFTLRFLAIMDCIHTPLIPVDNEWSEMKGRRRLPRPHQMGWRGNRHKEKCATGFIYPIVKMLWW